MNNRNIKQYFNKEEDVNTDIFELEENVCEIKRMNIEDFKNLANKAGLLKKNLSEESKVISVDPEEMVISSFEIVED